jgi:hypothetical protein
VTIWTRCSRTGLPRHPDTATVCGDVYGAGVFSECADDYNNYRKGIHNVTAHMVHTGVSSSFGRQLTDQLLERSDCVVGTVRDTGRVTDLLARYPAR